MVWNLRIILLIFVIIFGYFMTGFVNEILKPTMLWNLTQCKFVRQLTAILNPKAEFSRLLENLVPVCQTARRHRAVDSSVTTECCHWSRISDNNGVKAASRPLSNCQRTVGGHQQGYWSHSEQRAVTATTLTAKRLGEGSGSTVQHSNTVFCPHSALACDDYHNNLCSLWST